MIRIRSWDPCLCRKLNLFEGKLIVKPKVVITVIASIVIVVAACYAYMNRAKLFNWVPTSPGGADSGAAYGTASVSNGMDPAGRARKSYEVLGEARSARPPANANRFFYTEEQARRLGLRKYRSGPCAGYYEGEEWACNPAQAGQGSPTE